MTSFIGRTSLLYEGIRLLNSARLVTLIGTGGVGKTRLLERLAAELHDRGTYKRIVLVRLTDLKATDEQRLESTIAEAVGIGDNAATNGLARLIDYLREKQWLLLLDNCEHIAELVSRLVTTLLKAAPGLQIMTTSRKTLGVQGEHLLAVPPLCAGTILDHEPPFDGEPVHEAVQLLIDRARAVGVDIAERDYPLAERLCAMLDGIPLAIELAAVRLASMTLQEIVEHPSLLRLLVDGPSEQRHHHTLRAAMDWSYELLPKPERQMWGLVSVFEGGFDRDAATAICREFGFDEHTALELLDKLVRSTLLVTEAQDGRTRYRMLDTIREYGQELVTNTGESAQLSQAHADYFAHLTSRCARECLGPREIPWMRQMRRELPNLRLAQEWLLADPGQAHRGLQLALEAASTRFVVFDGVLNEGRRMLRRGLAKHVEPASPSHVAALAMTAWAAQIQGHEDLAAPLLDQAEQLARELGCYDTSAPLLYARATQLWLAEPDIATARQAYDLFDHAVEAFRVQGTRMDRYMVKFFKAMAAAFFGDGELAIAESQLILQEARAAGAQWCMAWARWTCALTELRFGDAHKAVALCQTAMRDQRETGDKWTPTWTVWLRALCAAKLGQFELAAQLFGGTKTGQQMTQTSVLGLLPWLRMQQEAEGAARRAIGDDEFEIQMAVGEALPLDEIFDLVEQPLAGQPGQAAENLPGGLSKRELEIADLVAKGMSNREIHQRLHISVRTVDVHIQHINAKLGTTNRTQIAGWRLRHSDQAG